MFQELNFTTEVFSVDSDGVTKPVELYANLRGIFPGKTLLLECAEPHAPQSAASFVCADPIAEFTIENGWARIECAGLPIEEIELTDSGSAIFALTHFQKSIKILFGENQADEKKLAGLFGYIGYGAIPYFEDIRFSKMPPDEEQIPDARFTLYRFVFRFDHFQNTLTAIKLSETPSSDNTNAVGLAQLFAEATGENIVESSPFTTTGAEFSELSDEGFAEIVRVCQRHIRRGDVFQIVPSRKFVVPFCGDEFAVYLALRSINPSPYLFFFDYGDFSLFGSSPEAQLLVNDKIATLHPIAGTYPRGKSEAEDLEFADRLSRDPKETAEHTMLVDLARNDLSRNCELVRVEQFKKIEFYSHVIHLVSRVCGQLNGAITNAAQILADTFPAGTLSGAPKYRAMQIINELEPSARSFYGGAVGFLELDGDATLAIMIRSFLAKEEKLIFQAGAGIVADSVPENETAEVRNKLAALRRAVEQAEREFKQSSAG